MKIKFFFVALFALMSVGISAQSYMGLDLAMTTLKNEVKSLEGDVVSVPNDPGVGAATATTGGDSQADVAMKLRIATMVLDNVMAAKDAETGVIETRNQLTQYSQYPEYTQALGALEYVDSLISN